MGKPQPCARNHFGTMVMRVATFFPFQTTHYLKGRNYIEQELNLANIAFRKNDYAFLGVDYIATLQKAPTRNARRSICRAVALIFRLAD